MIALVSITEKWQSFIEQVR